MHWYHEVDKRLPAVSPALLKVAMPKCPDVELWADELSNALDRAGISDQSDVALFLAHVGHESSDLTRLVESLNYSVGGLLKTFGRHRISEADTRRYGRRKGHPADQDAIAEAVYGGEWGERNLGNTEPGDGARYIGRGPIQLTGRYNYERLQLWSGLPVLEYPDRVAEHAQYGAMAATWFWNTNITPGGGIMSTTREVNGGLNGLADRIRRHNRILGSP